MVHNENNKVRRVDYLEAQNFDDTQYLCFQLTARQALLLLSQTEYFAWSTRWQNLPDNIDIRSIRDELEYQLMNGEDCDIMSLTKDDICEAVECGVINVFERAVAGQAGNLVNGITLNPDGSVTVDDSGTGGAGEFSAPQERAGAVENVRLRLNEYLQDWSDFYDEFEPSETAPIQFLKSKYLVDAVLIDGTYPIYDAQRDGSGGTITPFTDDLDGELYCDNITRQVVSGHVIDGAFANKSLMLLMLDCLLQTQYEVWANEGAEYPSDDFLDFPCARYIPLSFTVNASQFATTGYHYFDIPSGSWKPSSTRRIQVTVTGRFTDGAGNSQDAFYRTETSNINKIPDRFTWWTLYNSASAPNDRLLYPTNSPAYAENSTYQWIRDLGISNAGDGFDSMRIRFNNTENDDWRSSAAGELQITIIDLGELPT